MLRYAYGSGCRLSHLRKCVYLQSPMTPKAFLKNISPPILAKAYRRLKSHSELTVNFKNWWQKYSERSEVPADLKVMLDAYLNSPTYRSSSKYWDYLNKKNIEQLVDSGFENFRQTVACNYFTVAGPLEGGFYKKLAQDIGRLEIDLPIDQVVKKHDLFSLEQSIFYNISVALLLNHLVKLNPQVTALLKKLEEPKAGNLPYIEYEGIRVSQDMLNSLLEYHSISSGCEMDKAARVVEVGAGFGRTAFCVLKLNPKIKYVIADIPPALYVSQTFLSLAFPEKKIFRFRPFTSYEEIKAEFESAEIAFIMPHQLDLLPAKAFDLFLAIDCLHEMKRDQIRAYFEHANRLAKQLYFKCWQSTVIPFDNIRLEENDYPVKESWQKVFHRHCLVPDTFFEACYKLD